MNDRGIASLLFAGSGLSADVVIDVFMNKEVARAKLTKCSITLDTLDLTFERAEHGVIDTLLTPIFQAQLRTQIEDMISRYIRGSLVQVVDQMNGWFASRPFERLMEEGNRKLREAAEYSQKAMEEGSQKLQEAKDYGQKKLKEGESKLKEGERKMEAKMQPGVGNLQYGLGQEPSS